MRHRFVLVILVLAVFLPTASFAKSIKMPRDQYCWKLNEETRDWVNLSVQADDGSNPVEFAAEEISRLFRVKEPKPTGWKCQAYYLFEALKKLTSDEQIRAQKNAGEISFNSSTGFLGTGWWASKGVTLSDGVKNPVFSFIAPSVEDLQKSDYFHGQYVKDDVLEYYLLGIAYKTEKPIPTNSKERLALLQDIEKRREATREQTEVKIDRMSSRLEEVQGAVRAAQNSDDYGVKCSENCLPKSGKPCAVAWVKTRETAWEKARYAGKFCEVLFNQGALEAALKDVPQVCKDIIKKCPVIEVKKRVGEVEKLLERYKKDLEYAEKDLETLSERIEEMKSEVRTKTGDSRKATDRRSKPGSETTSETKRSSDSEGTPAE